MGGDKVGAFVYFAGVDVEESLGEDWMGSTFLLQLFPVLVLLLLRACVLDLVFEVRDAGRLDGCEDCESAFQPLIYSVSAAYTSLPALLHQVQSVTRQCAFERSDQLHQLEQVLGFVKEV